MGLHLLPAALFVFSQSGAWPPLPYCPSPAHAAEAIRSLAKEGDTVVSRGAGDVIKVTASLFES